VGDGVQISVSASSLVAAVTSGDVRVHRHGSGKYRGRYLALRRSAGRREILATGRPDPLRLKLSSMGIALLQEGEQWTAHTAEKN
jgi:hypothetical protein